MDEAIKNKLPNFKNNTHKLINVDGHIFRLFIIMVFIFLLMCLFNPNKFPTFRNFSSMSFQFPELGLFAMAVALSLISGGIDLSIVSIANFASILAAFVLITCIPENSSITHLLLTVGGAIFLAVMVGLVCGAINGALIAYIGITPILATLGTMQLFMGISIVITKGTAISGYPDQFLYLGNGMLSGVPMPLIIFMFIAVLISVILKRTRFGINLYMIGTNEVAALFSGINVRLMLLKTYISTGLLSGVTGILMIARTNSAKADYGGSYLLQAVLVAVLGGVDPKGGAGNTLGLVMAVLSLQFLSSGFNMLRFNNFAKEFMWGMFLLFVMVLNYFFNARKLSTKR